MAWATATFWIPMLFLLWFWRHGVKRYPAAYAPEYWGMVFPLGMYTACTAMLARSLNLEFLLPLPEAFVYVALAAWAAVFCGMVITRLAMLLRGIARRRNPNGGAAEPNAVFPFHKRKAACRSSLWGLALAAEGTNP